MLSGDKGHCSEHCVLLEWRIIHTLLRHSLTFVPPPLTIEEEFRCTLSIYTDIQQKSLRAFVLRLPRRFAPRNDTPKQMRGNLTAQWDAETNNRHFL